MNYSPSSMDKKLDSFDIIKIKKSKPANPIISLKKKKDLFRSLFLNKAILFNRKNNYKTYHLNKIKNISLQNELIKSKTRNTNMKNLFKCNSDNKIKENEEENNKITNNDNFLLLTSLYKLPSIMNQTKLATKIKLFKKPTPKSPIFIGTGFNNSLISQNNSSRNSKSFNNISTSTYNESFNNFLNLRYSREINKNGSEFNLSNQSNIKKKVFSNLYASLKDKYYIDIEKKYDHKLDVRLFPSDHSIKDKIIHMKKVSIFWNSVFKYCIPIINDKKYKIQHKFIKLNKSKELVKNKNHSNYYDIFTKNNKNYKIEFNKSKSLSKILRANIIK